LNANDELRAMTRTAAAPARAEFNKSSDKSVGEVFLVLALAHVDEWQDRNGTVVQ
jgi:hypothetical protein